MKLEQRIKNYAPYDQESIQRTLAAELAENKAKIIVLDDDPTGTQTVHDVNVYTNWNRDSIRDGLDDGHKLFFILTNSRAFDSVTTRRVHRDIATNIISESPDDFILISRSDSTLRGHYPLETETLKNVLQENHIEIDGEIIFPFFPEGGRYTIDHVHYVLENDTLIPVSETEFAKDKSFGYSNSDLKKWVEEKTAHQYSASDVTSITLDELRQQDYDAITDKLCKVSQFGKITVDSVSYVDVMVFAIAYYRALARGKRFIFRSAAALVQVLGGIEPRPLLTETEFRQHGNPNGGLIIVGSHVKKTTDQLEKLKTRKDIYFIEMNQHLAVDPAAFGEEVKRVKKLARDKISQGVTVAVYTRRERFDLNTGNKEDELRLAAEISSKLTEVVSSLDIRPSFIIGKGGITSSDIATKGLLIKKAIVFGQILPGVPVWLTNDESRFPGMPYVIFPGNVGNECSLLDAVDKLKGEI